MFDDSPLLYDLSYLSIQLRASLDDSIVDDPSLHGIDEVDDGQRRLVGLVLEVLDLRALAPLSQLQMFCEYTNLFE